MPSLVEVAAVGGDEYRARRVERQRVVERVEQVMVKLARQRDGMGVGVGRRGPVDVQRGQIGDVLQRVWGQVSLLPGKRET